MEGELAAAPRLAAHLQPAAMRDDQRLRDAQPQPHALQEAATRWPAPKRLKQAGLIGGAYPWPRVAHANPERISPDPCLHEDGAVGGGVAERVGEQVAHCLPQPIRVEPVESGPALYAVARDLEV